MEPTLLSTKDAQILLSLVKKPYMKSFLFLFCKKEREEKQSIKTKIIHKQTAICVEGFPKKSFDTNGGIIILLSGGA